MRGSLRAACGADGIGPIPEQSLDQERDNPERRVLPAAVRVDRGQVEAARALSLKRHQIFRYVRFPQMWRLALPNFGNHMLSIMKDTALVSVIGLEEILFVAKMANSIIHRPFLLYMTVALIYLAVTTVITSIVAWLELRANRHLRGAR